MIATAPAKVILSGEHAVVHGSPALAAAVRHFAVVEANPAPADQIHLRLMDLGIERCFSVGELMSVGQSCRQRHLQYLGGQLPINDVATPEQLLATALADLLCDVSTKVSGIELTIRSHIPIGAGMGSSAAIVAALLLAAAEHWGLALSRDALMRQVVSAECLQHGRSSGLDPATCIEGGIIRFDQGRATRLDHALTGSWLLVQTGQPLSSTGECVDQVERVFAQSNIWSAFCDVTESLVEALARSDHSAICSALRNNHQLLCDIGVVPAPVQDFIAGIIARGGAAKICGAGAVRGDAGGLVLVYHPESLGNLPIPGHYRTLTMELDFDGARVRS